MDSIAAAHDNGEAARCGFALTLKANAIYLQLFTSHLRWNGCDPGVRVSVRLQCASSKASLCRKPANPYIRPLVYSPYTSVSLNAVSRNAERMVFVLCCRAGSVSGGGGWDTFVHMESGRDVPII